MSGAGRHPCCFCHALKTSWDGDLSLRTWASIITHYYELVLQHGGNTDFAKFHYNCIGKPMIGDGSDTPVLWSIVPAFLHIILSLNNLLKALWDQWNGLMDWMALHHLQFEPYHGGCLGKFSRKIKIFSQLSSSSPSPDESQSNSKHRGLGVTL